MSLLTLESENLWEKLIIINEKSPFRSAAVAYFSSDIDLKFIKGDLLIINASPESIQSGATSLDLIEKYLIEGVEIYSNSTLHTKLIIFCEYVYIGSANISRNSKSNLIEAGILTNDKNIIDQSINLIKSIKSDYKTIKIDQAAIDQLKSIKVDRFNILSREKFRLLENNKKYWALGIFQEALYDGDQDIINNQCKLFKEQHNNLSWLFFKKSDAKILFEECQMGDSIVLFSRERLEDSIQEIFLVKVIHLFEDKDNNKVCFYEILKRVDISENIILVQEHFKALYDTEWIAKELTNSEVREIRKTILNTF